jgi:hypothetical protein
VFGIVAGTQARDFARMHMLPVIAIIAGGIGIDRRDRDT